MNEVLTLFTFFGTELWILLQEMFAMCFIIASISIFFTQAFKLSDRKVFLEVSVSKKIMWFVNLFFVVFLSITFIFVFDGKNGVVQNTIYMLSVIAFSWALSVVLYDYFVKYLLLGFEIGKLKLESIKVRSKVNKNKIEVLLEESKKELILTKLKD
jgi:hypothetical protein